MAPRRSGPGTSGCRLMWGRGLGRCTWGSGGEVTGKGRAETGARAASSRAGISPGVPHASKFRAVAPEPCAYLSLGFYTRAGNLFQPRAIWIFIISTGHIKSSA